MGARIADWLQRSGKPRQASAELVKMPQQLAAKRHHITNCLLLARSKPLYGPATSTCTSPTNKRCSQRSTVIRN